MPLRLPENETYKAVLAVLLGRDGLRKNCGMTVRKLTDSDKHNILNLYRKPGETTSTLADRYGVSNSTISRLLKSTLPEDEYEALIASKRAARTYYSDATQTPLFTDIEPDVSVAEPLVEVEPSQEPAESTPAPKRLTQPDAASSPESLTQTAETQLELLEIPAPIPAPILSPSNQNSDSNRIRPPQLLNPQPLKIAVPSPSQLDEDSGAQASAVAQMLGEDLLDESEEELTDLDDDDDEDLEDDDEDYLDEDTSPIVKRQLPAQTLVQVLPLTEASLPKTCYLVIDRASELITRPLRDFGELGQIPTQEVQQRTLPVFDNHRVARRFSTKRDRVIKIPDSKMLQKTRSHLQAKGITLLLVDGQVYSLSLTSP